MLRQLQVHYVVLS